MSDKDQAILICGKPENALPGSVEDTCADCGCKVAHMPSDPEIPDDAAKVCFPCGMKRVADSKEVAEWRITKQNEEHLRKLGWQMKKGTVH